MQNNVERAKDLLPAIILTILSMIQALALELFWSKIEDATFLWNGGLEAIIGWLQLVVMLVGMLLIWVFYVSFVLRFTWLPSMEDTLMPFLIGLLEFAMIDMMHPQHLGVWFVLLAGVFTTATIGSHLTMRQARQDPANDYFFNKIGASSWRDYTATIVVVTVFCLFGLGLWASDYSGPLSVVALVIALAALCYQFAQAKHYWMHSLVAEDRAEAENEEP